MNISGTSLPVLVKFYVQHQLGGEKAALWFGADWIKTVVVMETKSPIDLYNGENDVSTFSLSFFLSDLRQTCRYLG